MAVAEAEHVLQSTRLAEMSMEVLESALLTLVYTDRLESAATWCGRLLHHSSLQRPPALTAILNVAQALVFLRGGELAESVAYAHAALHGLPAQSWGVGRGLPLDDPSRLEGTQAGGQQVRGDSR